MSDTERAGSHGTETEELDQLSAVVMDLAELVERLTHEDDVLAVPEGRLEAERLAREARELTARKVTPVSPVEVLAGRRPVQVPVSLTLRQVAHELVREGVGAVVVEGTLSAAGVFSERDLVRAVASGSDPDTELAAHWMHKPLVSVDPRETVLGAGRSMVEHHVRHLVLSEDDHVTGVVSARDVLACLTGDAEPR